MSPLRAVPLTRLPIIEALILGEGRCEMRTEAKASPDRRTGANE